MLLLSLLMIIVWSSISLIGSDVKVEGLQIIILAIVSIVLSAIIKLCCKRSVIDLLEDKTGRCVGDDFMFILDFMEVAGGWMFIPIVVYAVSSGFVIKGMMENFTFSNTTIIKPLIFLIIAEIIIAIGCFICDEKRSIPVILYLEADVLSKTILFLAGLLLITIVAGLYFLLGIVFIVAFLGSSFGGN